MGGGRLRKVIREEVEKEGNQDCGGKIIKIV